MPDITRIKIGNIDFHSSRYVVLSGVVAYDDGESIEISRVACTFDPYSGEYGAVTHYHFD